MNKFIKNNFNKILSIFILLHPVIDLITGICLHVFNFNLTLGNIIRILFLLFVIYTTVFIYKKKKAFIYYFIIGIYFVLYFLNCIVLKNSVGIFIEIQGLIRTFYFPIMLLSLFWLKDEIKISKKVLISTLIIYLLCIFVPVIFSVGYKSYEITKNGTLGFYNSANEISGIISILVPIALITFKNRKKLVFKIILSIIYFFVIFTVGTKTPLLSFLITILMMSLWIIKECIKCKKYKLIIYMFVIILLGSTSLIIVLPKTNFYKNIKVHLDYLEVDSLIDIIKDEDLIDHFVFSQRLTFWENREETFKNKNVYQKLIGMGYLENGKEAKLVEMDYIDIYYNHGIIGFIILFSSYFFVLVKTFQKKRELNYERYMTLVSFGLILLLSLLTGHIITAPSVSLIVIAIILNLNEDKLRA